MEKYTVFKKSAFRRGAKPPPPPDKQDKAEMAFRLFDKDKDGFITKREMEKLSKSLSKEQVEKVMFVAMIYESSGIIPGFFQV